MSDISAKVAPSFSSDPLSEDQEAAFKVLIAFGLSEARALEMVWIFRPQVIIEQTEKMMHVRHVPTSALVLFRLIETAQRRAEQFAIRAAERFTQDFEQRQSQKEYIQSISWGSSALMTALGTLYRIVGQTDCLGTPGLLVETDGVACKISVKDAMERYKLIS